MYLAVNWKAGEARMYDMIGYIGYGTAFIAFLAWASWVWQVSTTRGGFDSPMLALIWTILAVLLLAGCADLKPYVGYTHLSDPSISGDGYDLLCGGAKYREAIEVSLGACKNVRGDELIRVDVELVWND